MASTHALGKPVWCEDVELTVHSFGPHLPVGASKVPEGHALWVALVAMRSLTEAPVYYATHNWHMYDVEDFAYDAISQTGLVREPRLLSNYLAPGARVKGHVTFQLPLGFGARPPELHDELQRRRLHHSPRGYGARRCQLEVTVLAWL